MPIHCDDFESIFRYTKIYQKIDLHTESKYTIMSVLARKRYISHDFYAPRRLTPFFVLRYKIERAAL